jgi:hypothetical protein
MSGTIIKFKRHDPPGTPPLERHCITPDIHSELIGLNQRQEEMARRLSWAAGMHDDLMDALIRFHDAQDPFNRAVQTYRETLLRALATKCPAAAKRIEQGRPPRRRRRRP